jgi:outer membrane protein assembly factor BamB
MLAALVLIAACNTSTPAPVSGARSDWPMYRGDLSRDGNPSGVALTTEQASHLKPAWTAALDGAVDGTPVVAGNTVIAGSEKEIAAIDLASGRTVWSNRGLGSFSGSPAVSGNVVVAATLTGHVYAFDLGSGRRLWDWKAGGIEPAFWASPAIYGKLVLISVGSQYGDQPLEPGAITALDLSSGAQQWRFCIEAECAPGGGVWSSVAVDAAGRGFVGTGNPDDGVLSFDASTGKKLWVAQLHQDGGQDIDVGATPIVAFVGNREVVAVGSDGGLFDMFDAVSGKLIWSRFLVTGSAVHGLIASPAYDGTSFFVPSTSSPTGLFALDPATGSIQWEQGSDLPVYSAPALGKRVLIYGTGDALGDPRHGSLVALSTTDGSVAWTYDMHQSVLSAPAISGTTVIVGDTHGSVRAFSPA